MNCTGVGVGVKTYFYWTYNIQVASSNSYDQTNIQQPMTHMQANATGMTAAPDRPARQPQVPRLNEYPIRQNVSAGDSTPWWPWSIF